MRVDAGRRDTLSLSNHTLTLTHQPQIADFGMSRDMQLASRIETSTYGTVTHMPPELLTDGRLSRAADVYSFGVILNEMYCGALLAAALVRCALLSQQSMSGGACSTQPAMLTQAV